MIEKIINTLLILISQNIQETLMYNIFKDFIFPLLLTISSGIFAWFIFFKQILNEKQKDKETKEEDLKNKLTYFAMIIQNAIENATGQNDKVKQLILEMGNSEVNFLSLEKYPTYDLKILAEKIDKENYLISFLNYYSEKSKKDMLNDFKNIVDSCSIINDVFDQINSDLESKQLFENKLKEKFSQGIFECSDLFGKALVKWNEDKNPLFYKLFEISKKTNELKNYHENSIFEAQYRLFLIPTLLFLDECHSKNIEFDEIVGNLWTKSSDSVNIYDNLKSETTRLKEMLTQQNQFVIELIETLKKSSAMLRKDLLN